MLSMFLSISDLELLDEVSSTTAQRRLAEIRAHFAVKKYKKISVVQYADFHNFDVAFVLEMLEKKRRALRK